jgi:hypothetical protein
MIAPLQKNWRRVVIVSHDRERSFVVVQNSFEATEYLVHCWPVRSGAAFCHALKTCTDALDGRASEEEAHSSFLAAAREADVAITVH